MEAGTLVEWEKHPGDCVKRGDVVAVVETQKGAIEVEIFVDGKMGKQLVPLGTKVPVGTPLAEIEGAVEAMPAPPTGHAPRRPKGAACRRRPPHPARKRLFVPRPRRASSPPNVASTSPRSKARVLPAASSSTTSNRRSPCRRRAAAPRPRSRQDAQGHRRGDGALQARNSALLSCPRHRHGGGAVVAGTRSMPRGCPRKDCCPP